MEQSNPDSLATRANNIVGARYPTMRYEFGVLFVRQDDWSLLGKRVRKSKKRRLTNTLAQLVATECVGALWLIL